MKRYQYALLVVGTTFLMGVAFPIGGIGMRYASPLLLMSLRFLVAGVLMAAFVAAARRRQPNGLKLWLRLLVIGCCQTAGAMGFAYYAMQWITSGEAAILTFTNPLLVIVLSTLLLGARYRIAQWFGVVLGLLGVAVTFGSNLSLEPGMIIGFMSGVSFAAATLFVRRWGSGFDTWVMTAYQMLLGGLVLLAASALLEKPHFTLAWTSVMVVLGLAVFCSIVQFSCWYYLLGIGDPGKTSSYLFLAPMFGVLSGWALLGEKLEWYVGAGALLICAGIYLVNRPRITASVNSQ